MITVRTVTARSSTFTSAFFTYFKYALFILLFVFIYGSKAWAGTVTVNVTWPLFPGENSAFILDPAGSTVATITSATPMPATYNLPDGIGYTLIMQDSIPDGWDGAANITVAVDGTTVISNDGPLTDIGAIIFNVGSVAPATLAGDVMVCAKAGAELNMLASWNANSLAKLRNTAYFGSGGGAAPETLGFKQISLVNTTNLINESCDIFIGGGIYNDLDTTEAQALSTWLAGSNRRFVIAGCDRFDDGEICTTGLGRSLTNIANGGITIDSTLTYNPIYCGGVAGAATFGGESAVLGTTGSDVVLATHNANGSASVTTDSLTAPSFLMTADADMLGNAGSTAIGTGATATTDQALLLLNVFKFAVDEVAGRPHSCATDFNNPVTLPPADTSATYCPAQTTDTPYTDYRIAWTYNSPTNTLLPDHTGGGWANNQFDESVIASAPAQTVGAGMSYTFDGDKQTVIHLSNVDQSTAAAAMDAGDYIEYQFTTTAGMNPAQLFNGFAFASHNYTENYQISILFSKDDFATATNLLSDYTVTQAGGAYQWIDSATDEPLYLIPNTTYKFRILFYNASNPAAVYWDDFHASMGVCQDFSDAPVTNYAAVSHDQPRNTDVYLGAAKADAESGTRDGGDAGAGADGDDTGGLTPDDEDGVNITAVTLTQGQTTAVTATVSGTGGYLQGWIDFDGNGTFDAGEQIATDYQDGGAGDTDAAAGTITLNVAVPAGAVTTQTFARFRWSTTSGLDATTAANDGEVEDYALTINGGSGWPTPPPAGPGDGGSCLLTHHNNGGVAADPNSFYKITDHTNPTTLEKIGDWNLPGGLVEGLTADVANKIFYALNNNRGGAMYVGTVDYLAGSYANITTTGISTLNHATYGTLNVSESRAIAHRPGTNELWVGVYDEQASSSPGATYAYLFKVDTTTGQAITGAFGGNDYLAIDLAPYKLNSTGEYATVEAITFHRDNPNILYGVVSTANVSFTPQIGHLFAVDISAGTPQAVLAPNNFNGTAFSGSLITSDYFDIEGISFDTNNDLVIISSNLGGTNANSILTVDPATGTASNKRTIISGDWEGIVCDPEFIQSTLDYGDAPVSGTAPDNSSTNNYGAASHTIVSDIYLGAGEPDADAANQADANALGDDNDGTDDEDGVNIAAVTLTQGQTTAVTATVSGAGGYLQGWIDFDGNGTFDAGEQIATDIQDGGAGDTDATAGTITVDVAVPAGAVTTQTYARFRWSTTAGLDATTAASDGEVEDYTLMMLNSCEVIPSGEPTAALTSGQVTWNVTNGVLESILVSGETDTFNAFITPDSIAYSFANVGASNQLVIDKNGSETANISQGSGIFDPAVIAATSDRHLGHYLQLDNGIISTDYVDFLYNDPVYSAGNRYVVLTERNGNNTISAQALDASGNPIGSIVAANAGSYIGTGYSEAAFGQEVKAFVYPLTALVSSGTEIHGIRYSQSGATGNDGGDGKVFIMGDSTQMCGRGSGGVSFDYDFGDAPVSGTAPDNSSTNNYGAASHIIVSGTYLGAGDPDADAANQADANALGDDNDGTDDEDGVNITAVTLVKGQTTAVTAAVNGAGGYLQGWIDFDGNGTFDAGEQIATDIQDGGAGDTDATAGTITVDVAVPAGAVTGQTFARFRWSTTAGLDATTAANDGEVEDYAVTIIGNDYGDAPGYGDAYHSIDGIRFMGSAPDVDTGTVTTNGDASDDANDDGVFTDAGLTTGLQGTNLKPEDSTTVYVPVSGSGNLHAWIDWDSNGVFGNNANELIADGVAGSDETLAVTINIPLGATLGTTYARFRFSADAAAANPTGAATGGEVEDYQVIIANTPTTPTGTAPTYCTSTWVATGSGGYESTTAQGVTVTTTATAGANSSWSFAPNDALNTSGAFSDTALNGAASLSSVFTWDTSAEDGRNANAADDAETGTLTFAFSVPVKNPVIHIDRIGGYGGHSEATPQALSNSSIITPNTANSGATFSQLAGTSHFEVTAGTIQRTPNESMVFGESSGASGTDSTRYTAMGTVEVNGVYNSLSLDFTGVGVEGAAADGIEFVICAQPEDYSDAPGSYQDATHTYTPAFSLGDTVDFDSGSLASNDATADGADDDGIAVPFPALTQGKTTPIDVAVTEAVRGTGYLQGWIDFDGSGTFDAGEQVATDYQDDGNGDKLATYGIIRFYVTVPDNATLNQTFARFRWSGTAGLGVSGAAADGEVEDYALTILPGGFTVSGRVYNDSNADGINDAAEAGISELPLVLFDTVNNTCVSSRTDGDGYYTFFGVMPGNYQVYEASQETVPTPQSCDPAQARDPSGYLSTTSNVSTAFAVTNAPVTDIDFGDVTLPAFVADNTGDVLPGNVTFYAHTFTPPTSGSVNFTLSANDPAGWSSVLYHDADCSGDLNGTEADAELTAALATTAGTDICLVHKVFAPANSSMDQQSLISITADFTYGNGTTLAANQSLLNEDITTVSGNPVSGEGKLELIKTVQNLTQGSAETMIQNTALPGDTLQYRITYRNTGTGAITDLDVSDTVPPFTLLDAGSVVCETTPVTLSCIPNAANDPDISWGFSGQLEAGVQGVVSYRVVVE